jgi:hypothetical protein
MEAALAFAAMARDHTRGEEAEELCARFRKEHEVAPSALPVLLRVLGTSLLHPDRQALVTLILVVASIMHFTSTTRALHQHYSSTTLVLLLKL